MHLDMHLHALLRRIPDAFEGAQRNIYAEDYTDDTITDVQFIQDRYNAYRKSGFGSAHRRARVEFLDHLLTSEPGIIAVYQLRRDMLHTFGTAINTVGDHNQGWTYHWEDNQAVARTTMLHVPMTLYGACALRTAEWIVGCPLLTIGFTTMVHDDHEHACRLLTERLRILLAQYQR